MTWVNAILQGIFLGGLYALFASGLSLMFGVMRFVNFAHGDFIIVSAYALLSFVFLWGWHPALAVIVVIGILGAAGYANQRFLLNRVLGKGILPPVLVTFGMSIIIQNLLMEFYSADSQKIQTGTFETVSLKLSDDISVGLLPFLIFVTAIAVIGGLQLIFYRTSLGRLLRATSDDQQIIPLMGGNNAHIFALATMIASLVVAIAGMFLAMKTNFDPTAGPSRLLFAFEAIIIGGLGNLWGTLLGGIILGVSQTIGAQIDAGFQILAGHLAFLAILVFRPSGLFPKIKD